MKYMSSFTIYFLYFYNMILPFIKLLKAVNTKLVLLINCIKINHQQKHTFMMCKLNGPFLESLKIKWSGPKSHKKKILFCFGAQIKAPVGFGPGPKFKFFLRAGPRLKFLSLLRAGTEKSGSCRPLGEVNNF